ncbi:transcriptional regulator, TetR family [Sphingobium faniae]|nr:transcriptional regulator, TetR family [Sphingobium faniae]
MEADDDAMTSATQLEVRDARTRILDAAAHLFRSAGFSGTSMDAIAALARMSKRTLYAIFPDKRAILETVLHQFIARRFALIGRVNREPASDEAMLTRIVRGLNAMATDKDALIMYRLLVAEAESLPALALTANRDGLAQAVDMLREPLRKCGIADPDPAARLLYDLAVLAPMHRRLVGTDNLHMDIDALVHMVLRGMKGM